MQNIQTPRQNRDIGRRRHLQTRRADHGMVVHRAMRVTIVTPRSLHEGIVVLARIPFKDRDDFKVRPAIVISVEGEDIRVRPCTSSLRGRGGHGAIAISDLAIAGLSRPTAARSRTDVLPIGEIVEIIGHLSECDATRILGATRSAVAA